MYRERKRRKIIIFSLLSVLLLMVGGYAAFQSKLDIKGSTKVTTNWEVLITNVTPGTPTGNAENSKDETGNVILPTWNGLSASMSADLYDVGDSMEYIVTVTNRGNLDATLDEVLKTDSSNSAVIITYSGYAEGQKLRRNSSMDIKVKVEYNPEYTGEGEVTGSSNITFSFKEADSKLDNNDNPVIENDTVISKDSYKLTYQCEENGGTNNQESVFDAGDNVDLSVKCTKDGYIFIGWNTDKNATSTINSYTMPNSDTVLYAIYTSLPVIDSVSTTKTSNSITVVVAAHDDSGITKYEFSSDGGLTWVDNGTNNMYTFTGLTYRQTYPIKVRVTNGIEEKVTSDNIYVSTNLQVPTYIEYLSDSDNTIVEITYPEECSNGTYTCSYKKDNETTVTVDSSNLVNNKINVEYTDSGTLIGYVSDGIETVSSTYTVTYSPGDNVTGENTYSTPGATTFTAPATGDYYLQVWGAQGGYRSSSSYGGNGGYSYGTVTLNKGDTLYVYVGGSGNTGGASGGYNGGGSRSRYNGGGGASDIRINSDSLYARVIVAGGGGSDGATSRTGMYGGGTSGGSSTQSCGTGGYGGTQTGNTWYVDSHSTSTSAQSGAYASFGYGGNGITRSSGYGGAGGGGWYGGSGSYPDSSADDDRGGGGGSGYVYTSSTASSYPSGCLLNSSYYLTNAATVAGNTSFESPSGGTETGHTGDGFAKISYNIQDMVNDRSTLAVNSVSTNSISVTMTPKSGLNVTKYEFSSDNGATWISNGKNGTYEFKKLTHNTTYNIKARITTAEGKVVNSIDVKTNELLGPTITDSWENDSATLTITYPAGCDGTYTCTYKKNSDSLVTVTSDTETVTFTSGGTLIASVSDGTNTVTTDEHNAEQVDMSFSTSKTTNSITVTSTATALTEIEGYEFQIDGGQWVQSTNNVYTFTGLSNDNPHTVNSRVITSFGTVKAGTETSVTLNSIQLPAFELEYIAADNMNVTITYPEGCGSTYTCTYTKNDEEPVTVTSTSVVVNYSDLGELAASVSDGINIVGASYTIAEQPLVSVMQNLGASVVTSGNGIYADEDEDGRYIFKGDTNTPNYINIKENGTDVKYRIYSVESDGSIKVIRNEGITNMYFDESDGSRRKSGYCTDYFCNAWVKMDSFTNGTGTGAVSRDSFMKEYIDGTYAPILDDYDKIVTKTWNIAGTVYNRDTIANAIADESKSKWSGKIALLTASEYVRANSNVNTCGALSKTFSNSSTCKSTNYLFKNGDSRWWLLSPESSSRNGGLGVQSYYSSVNSANATYPSDVRPSFYLCPGLTYGGSGTSDNPYYISGGSCINSQIVYRWSTAEWTAKQDISGMKEGTDYVKKASDVVNMDSRGANYYLKHLVEGNIVTETYVCFVTDTEHCLRGGTDNGEDPSNFYPGNVSLLTAQKSWFTGQSGSCTLQPSGTTSECSGGIFRSVYASNKGRADVYGENYFNYCYVGYDGKSYCHKLD